jgi:POT family proton-dependent oligopeptide transporter
MWERFSYYGMRALLILFMTAPVADGGLGFDTAVAGAIYGLYTSMVYMTSLPGGWFADRIVGQQRAVLYGGTVIACGHFCMAWSSLATFYLGLALIVIGSGLLKPNISVIVGGLYASDDSRRDAGFSIFYMGINIGAFLAPLICGYLGQRVNWHAGFATAGVGMVFGLIQYMLGAKYLGEAGLRPAAASGRSRGEGASDPRLRRWGVAALVLACGLIAALWTGTLTLSAKQVADAAGTLLLVSTVAFFAWLLFVARWSAGERRRLYVITVLFLAATLFWSEFEQAGSTLNLFADRATRTSIFGWEFPSSYFQSVQPLFIIAFAPAFAWLWVKLGRREPSSPAKFGLGLWSVGAGFLVLAVAAAIAATGVKVGPGWLVLTYLLHTFGELALSPVGLSAMTKLTPSRVAGLMMGVWFLALSVGNFIGGRLASLYGVMPLTHLFGTVGALGIGGGIVMLAVSKPMRRLAGATSDF